MELPKKDALMRRVRVSILVVEDCEPWRNLVCSLLRKRKAYQVVSEASDVPEAIQKAEELQPDLVLLDIGLPTGNGIHAAKQIHQVASSAKILFLSQNRDADVVRDALSDGKSGYVLKTDACSELLTGIEVILSGRTFVSSGLAVLANRSS